jgi:hypothetical protein
MPLPDADGHSEAAESMPEGTDTACPTCGNLDARNYEQNRYRFTTIEALTKTSSHCFACRAILGSVLVHAKQLKETPDVFLQINDAGPLLVGVRNYGNLDEEGVTVEYYTHPGNGNTFTLFFTSSHSAKSSVFSDFPRRIKT